MNDFRMEQLQEVECLWSMFPDTKELEMETKTKEYLETFINDLESVRIPEATKLAYTIRFQNLEMEDGSTPELAISYPPTYPDTPLDFTLVSCASLSRDQMQSLRSQLEDIATGSPGQVIVLELYQCMLDFLSDIQAQNDELKASMETMQLEQKQSEQSRVVLGRRAIYFHHIINPNKQKVVKEWAIELELGGYGKIGWPGIVIVEGDEDNVQEYVRRLQHLKWKQMVVRGEQTQLSQDNESIDDLRVLPKRFEPLPENGMPRLASECEKAGLKSLFLATMKIYNREEDTSRQFQK